MRRTTVYVSKAEGYGKEGGALDWEQNRLAYVVSGEEG